jgi:hypothetical protein
LVTYLCRENRVLGGEFEATYINTLSEVLRTENSLCLSRPKFLPGLQNLDVHHVTVRLCTNQQKPRIHGSLLQIQIKNINRLPFYEESWASGLVLNPTKQLPEHVAFNNRNPWAVDTARRIEEKNPFTKKTPLSKKLEGYQLVTLHSPTPFLIDTNCVLLETLLIHGIGMQPRL